MHTQDASSDECCDWHVGKSLVKREPDISPVIPTAAFDLVLEAVHSVGALRLMIAAEQENAAFVQDLVGQQQHNRL